MTTVDRGEPASEVTQMREPQIRAGVARAGWRSRYAVTLCLIDTVVGLCAASWALVLRFGSSGGEPYQHEYLLLTLILPVAWIALLALNRAYEPRHLFVGT